MSWDELHRQLRHKLRFPSEDVVRFMYAVANDSTENQTLLDLGCGSGRHMALAKELGIEPTGVDSSKEALLEAAKYGKTVRCDMTELPFPNESFDAVLSFGVVYYGFLEETEKTIGELFRVMKTGGHGYISIRTPRDWRYGLGLQVGQNTFRVRTPGEPEDGMVMNFLPASDLPPLFGPFTGLRIELHERTLYDRTRRESDWHLTVTK